MAEIHLRKDDGGDDLRDENDVRRDFQKGLISPDTLCWKEGMVAWQPVSEVFPARATAAASSAAAPPPLAKKMRPPRPDAVHHRYSLEPWAIIAEVMIVACFVMSALSLWGYFGQMSFVYVTFDQDTYAAALKHDALMDDLWWCSVGIWVVALVAYLVWLYRVNENCWSLAPGFSDNTIFVLVSYFIPFLNLIYPCHNMQGIWRASSHPENWKQERSSVLVGLWWGFSLASGVLSQAIFHLFPKVVDQNTLWEVTLGWMVFEVVSMVLAVLTLLMVYQVTANQKYFLAES